MSERLTAEQLAEIEALIPDSPTSGCNRISAIAVRALVAEVKALREENQRNFRDWHDSTGAKIQQINALRYQIGCEQLKAQQAAADERAAIVEMLEKRYGEYGELLDRGKGIYGKPGYVRDDTWREWITRRNLLEQLVSDIQAHGEPKSGEAKT